MSESESEGSELTYGSLLKIRRNEDLYMKLSEGVSTEIHGEEPLIPSQPSTAEYYAVFSGAAAEKFPEPIRIDEVTHFIMNELKEEKNEDELVKTMVETYEAEEAVIREDVHALLGQLRSAGIIAD